jgi:hypothetical protein
MRANINNGCSIIERKDVKFPALNDSTIIILKIELKLPIDGSACGIDSDNNIINILTISFSASFITASSSSPGFFFKTDSHNSAAAYTSACSVTAPAADQGSPGGSSISGGVSCS